MTVMEKCKECTAISIYPHIRSCTPKCPHYNDGISGVEFKKIYGIQFCKYLNDQLEHKKHKYKKGLNVDRVQFNPHEKCSKGGLYFTNEKYIQTFSHYGNILAKVSVPDDAKVYVEEFNGIVKFKADKIVVNWE